MFVTLIRGETAKGMAKFGVLKLTLLPYTGSSYFAVTVLTKPSISMSTNSNFWLNFLLHLY